MLDSKRERGKIIRIGTVVAGGMLAIVVAGVLLTGTFRTTEARHGTEVPAAVVANGSHNNLDIGDESQLPPQAPLEIADVAQTPEPTPEPPPEPTPVPTAAPAPPQAPVVVPTRTAAVVAATSIPPGPPAAAAAVALSSMEQEMYNLHNSERSRAGLGSLRLDATLTQIARQRAQDMATRNYFSHNSPTGQSAFSLMSSYGYRFDLAGENIARNNYPDNQATQVAMTGFMNSAEHRENILDRSFNYVGLGVAYGAGGMKYYAVVFAAH